MSSEKPTTLEFPFKIENQEQSSISYRDSSFLKLLGFDGGRIAVLQVPPKPAQQNCEAPEAKPEPPKAESSPIIRSVLQGKTVIIKTNTMSGEKLLIYKQKAGGSVEIPARHCSFVKTSESDAQSFKERPTFSRLSPPPLEPFSGVRYKPTILKQKGRLQYEIISNKTTQSTIIQGTTVTDKQMGDPNTSADGEVLRIVAQDDVKLFVKPSDEQGTVGQLYYIQNNEPLKTSRKEVLNGGKSIKTRENSKPSEELLNRLKAKVNGAKAKPAQHYQVVSKKKPASLHEGAKLTQIKTAIQNGTLSNIIEWGQVPKPPNISQVRRTKSTVSRGMQTSRLLKVPETKTRETRSVETNTDDTLLQEFINKKLQEKAVETPNPVSLEFVLPTDEKAHQVGSVPPSELPAPVNETVAPSPLSTITDNDLILNLCDIFEEQWQQKSTPIVGTNVNFGTGPVMGGKSAYNTGTGEVPHITDISHSRGKGLASLYNAVTNGMARFEPWRVQFFLDLKHCNQFDNYGNIPLHVAVMENKFNHMRRQCFALRIRNLGVDTLNHNSLTALQLGLLHNASVPVLQTLINHNADPTILDNEGNTVLHLAVLHAGDAVVQMLLGTCTALPIDASNFEGDTALILCVLNKQYVKADKILQAGANPNIGDKKSGRTPLFHAVEANDFEMVKLLLNYKAQTKVRNFFGTSPHDAMFELDSVDKAIRKLVLNKEYPQYRNRTEFRDKKKRKDPDDPLPTTSKAIKVRTNSGPRTGKRKL